MHADGRLTVQPVDVHSQVWELIPQGNRTRLDSLEGCRQISKPWPVRIAGTLKMTSTIRVKKVTSIGQRNYRAISSQCACCPCALTLPWDVWRLSYPFSQYYTRSGLCQRCLKGGNCQDVYACACAYTSQSQSDVYIFSDPTQSKLQLLAHLCILGVVVIIIYESEHVYWLQ